MNCFILRARSVEVDRLRLFRFARLEENVLMSWIKKFTLCL